MSVVQFHLSDELIGFSQTPIFPAITTPQFVKYFKNLLICAIFHYIFQNGTSKKKSIDHNMHPLSWHCCVENKALGQGLPHQSFIACG